MLSYPQNLLSTVIMLGFISNWIVCAFGTRYSDSWYYSKHFDEDILQDKDGFGGDYESLLSIYLTF